MGKTKGKRKKKKSSETVKRRPLPVAEDGQDICVCVKPLGQRRFRVRFPDGKERLGILAGRIRRNQFISAGTWVIASMREYQDEKADIFEVLIDDEVREMSATGILDTDLAAGINGAHKRDTGGDVIFAPEDMDLDDLIEAA